MSSYIYKLVLSIFIFAFYYQQCVDAACLNQAEIAEIDRRLAERNGGDGPLRVTLSWNALIDLDLHLFEPSGFEIYYLAPQSLSTGGRLDLDAIRIPNPIENIFYPASGAPRGNYKARVLYYGGLSNGNQIPETFTLVIKKDGVALYYIGVLSSNGQTFDIEFTY